MNTELDSFAARCLQQDARAVADWHGLTSQALLGMAQGEVVSAALCTNFAGSEDEKRKDEKLAHLAKAVKCILAECEAMNVNLLQRVQISISADKSAAEGE